MGRAPCCGDHEGLKRGPWTAEEDRKLVHYVQSHGLGNWRNLPKLAGLSRCGKSCRLRWANYLRPDIKRGAFSMPEELAIIRLHAVLGNKWSAIASHIPGRTDNEIKNHWNTKLKKRLLLMGIDPVTHIPLPTADMLSPFMASSSTAIATQLNSALVEAQLRRLARDYFNTSHVSAGSADHQYLWQLSQILNLLAAHNNPVSAGPSGLLSSISTNEFLQPNVLTWFHGSQNQINQEFISRQKDDSAKHTAFSQESLQFSDPPKKSKGKIPTTTDHRNKHRTPSSLIEERPSGFDTEITGWNPMPILMPSSNPHQNDQHYSYSDEKSSSTTCTNSSKGGSEITENTLQYQQDAPFGSAIRSSLTMSLPAPSVDLHGDESNYWTDLLNSIEDSNDAFPLPSP